MIEGPTGIIHHIDIDKKLSDAEKAAAYRAELTPILEKACEIIGRARSADGLIIGFNLGVDNFGRQRVLSLDVTKPL